MEEAISKLSILVSGSPFDAVNVALSTNDQLTVLLQTIAGMTSLECASGIPGGQCRVEANATIDDDHPEIVVVKTSCQVRGKRCGDTCDGVSAFLRSGYIGSLSLDQEISFI